MRGSSTAKVVLALSAHEVESCSLSADPYWQLQSGGGFSLSSLEGRKVPELSHTMKCKHSKGNKSRTIVKTDYEDALEYLNERKSLTLTTTVHLTSIPTNHFQHSTWSSQHMPVFPCIYQEQFLSGVVICIPKCCQLSMPVFKNTPVFLFLLLLQMALLSLFSLAPPCPK